MTEDRVNIAVVSIRKVQDRFPDIPEKFRQILCLVIEAYKQTVSNRCVLCRLTGKTSDALEQHHIAGRNNWPDSLSVCLSCHNRLTENQKKWQNDLSNDRIRLSSYFDGLRDLFELLWELTGESHYRALAKRFTDQAWSIRNSCTS